MSDKKEIIERIPYATIEDLPVELREVAEITKSRMDSESFNELLRDAALQHYGNLFADVDTKYITEMENNKIDFAAMRRKTSYAGALWYQTSKYESDIKGVGVYNPDKISYATYERMSQDAQIALCLAVIKKPIEHVNFSIECSSEKIKALVNWTLEKIYTRLVRDLLMAINMGHSCIEKNWYKIPYVKLVKDTPDNREQRKSDIVYEDSAYLLYPTAIHPQAYTLALDKFGDLTGILFEDINSLSSPTPKPIKRSKLIFYTNDMQYGNWFGNSRLKPVYPWWYWSQIVLQFMIRYLERRATPPIVVRAPQGFVVDKDGNQINNFALALKIGNGLVSNSVGVLPNLLTKDGQKLWDVGYMNDDQRLFMFIDVLNFCNIMMSRGLLVPESVPMSGKSGGSFSQTDAHADIHLMNEESLLREIEDVINNQIVPSLIKYNFAPEERVKCTVKLEKLTVTRKQLLKEILNKMMGIVNQMARDGAVPLVLPNIGEIAKALEIPVTRTDNIFNLDTWAPGLTANKNDENTTTDSSGNPDATANLDQQEKQDQNNKERDTKRPPIDRTTKRPKIA